MGPESKFAFLDIKTKSNKANVFLQMTPRSRQINVFKMPSELFCMKAAWKKNTNRFLESEQTCCWAIPFLEPEATPTAVTCV